MKTVELGIIYKDDIVYKAYHRESGTRLEIDKLEGEPLPYIALLKPPNVIGRMKLIGYYPDFETAHAALVSQLQQPDTTPLPFDEVSE